MSIKSQLRELEICARLDKRTNMPNIHPDLYSAIHNYALAVSHADRLATEYHAALQTVERRGKEIADVLHSIECPHPPTPERVEAVDKHYGTYPCETKPGFPNPPPPHDIYVCDKCGFRGGFYTLDHTNCPKCGAAIHKANIFPWENQAETSKPCQD